jgi:hypothetical protein
LGKTPIDPVEVEAGVAGTTAVVSIVDIEVGFTVLVPKDAEKGRSY